MSNIIIILSSKELTVTALGKLHKIVGGSLGKLKSAVTNEKPILEIELFDGQYEEKAILLRKLIGFFRENALSTEVYELPSEHAFETSDALQESIINLEILEKILQSSDQEMAR